MVRVFWFVNPKIVQAAEKEKFGNNYICSANLITAIKDSCDCRALSAPWVKSQIISIPKNITFPKSPLIWELKFYRLALVLPFTFSGLRSQIDLWRGKHRMMKTWGCCMRLDHRPWKPAGRDSGRAVHRAV